RNVDGAVEFDHCGQCCTLASIGAADHLEIDVGGGSAVGGPGLFLAGAGHLHVGEHRGGGVAVGPGIVVHRAACIDGAVARPGPRGLGSEHPAHHQVTLGGEVHVEPGPEDAAIDIEVDHRRRGGAGIVVVLLGAAFVAEREAGLTAQVSHASGADVDAEYTNAVVGVEVGAEVEQGGAVGGTAGHRLHVGSDDRTHGFGRVGSHLRS